MHNDRENIERLSREIDNTLNHPELYQSVMICEHTPQILQQLGLKDLPILMSQNHVRHCLHPKGKLSYYHGLHKNDLILVPQNIAAPAIVMDSFTDDESILVITNTVDIDKLPIICVIRSDGEGIYKLSKMQSNYLTSMYGRSNFASFFQRALNQNKVLYLNYKKIQDLERCSQLQLLKAYPKNLVSGDILHQSENVCNSAYPNNLFKSTSTLRSAADGRSFNTECDGTNKEVNPFTAYLDSVEDRAAEQNHIVQQTQQNNNQKDPKENGNEHD